MTTYLVSRGSARQQGSLYTQGNKTDLICEANYMQSVAQTETVQCSSKEAAVKVILQHATIFLQ